MTRTMLSSFDEISLLFETTQQSLGATLRGLKYRWVVSNNNEVSSNDDDVVQVRRRLVPKRGRVADGWHKSIRLCRAVSSKPEEHATTKWSILAMNCNVSTRLLSKSTSDIFCSCMFHWSKFVHVWTTQLSFVHVLTRGHVAPLAQKQKIVNY